MSELRTHLQQLTSDARELARHAADFTDEGGGGGVTTALRNFSVSAELEVASSCL